MIIIIVSGGDAFGGLQQQEIPQHFTLTLEKSRNLKGLDVL